MGGAPEPEEGDEVEDEKYAVSPAKDFHRPGLMGEVFEGHGDEEENEEGNGFQVADALKGAKKGFHGGAKLTAIEPLRKGGCGGGKIGRIAGWIR